MKATKLLLVAAAFAGLASLSFAGPGPEFWARMNAANKKAPAKNTVKAEPAAKPAAGVTAASASCSCSAKKV